MSLSKPLKIYQYIGSLGPGGAERQFMNLTAGLQARGHKVMACCFSFTSTAHCHYKALLEAKGSKIYHLHGMDLQRGIKSLRCREINPILFLFIPHAIRKAVLRLTGQLLADPPDVLHCWMDCCNCVGGWAGLLTGVPLIVLSFRNVNPSHFSYLYHPWMNSTYRFLASHPRVRLVANSILGGIDYSRWIGVPADKITVVSNALDTEMFSHQSGERRQFRQKLGIPPEAPVVIGIFRLSPEKQPFHFVEIIARLRQKLPDLKALHVGCGAMKRNMKALVRKYDLGDSLKLLGRRHDIQGLLAASDAFLLTSQHEGMPNVIMEAQGVGCPPVATRVGGVPDVVQEGITGFLHDCGDLEGMTESLFKLLTDADVHESMVKAGQDFIQREFPLSRLVDENLRIYYAGLKGK